MRLSLDPKPFGAFIEYTLKPLLEDSHELLEILDKRNIDINRLCSVGLWLFIVDKTLEFIKSVTVTGLICWTVYLILSNSSLTTL